jgi:hypothetical protein
MSTNYHSNSESHRSELMGMQLSLPMTRREALRVSLFSTAGLLLGAQSAECKMQSADAGVPSAKSGDPASKLVPVKAKAKSVIQIFLWGGMSHIDTWDPKPEAGREYMGDLFGAAASLAARPRWIGSHLGMAAAIITATFSPRSSRVADSKAATSSERPMRRPKRSRSGRCIQWTCLAASTRWAASTPAESCRIRWAPKRTCCRPPPKAQNPPVC